MSVKTSKILSSHSAPAFPSPFKGEVGRGMVDAYSQHQG
jgi:hypothetical protein